MQTDAILAISITYEKNLNVYKNAKEWQAWIPKTEENYNF